MYRRGWLAFTLRDLLWATVVLAMGFGWWMDRDELANDVQSWREFYYESGPPPDYQPQRFKKTKGR
jgi:hypothetical protein